MMPFGGRAVTAAFGFLITFTLGSCGDPVEDVKKALAADQGAATIKITELSAKKGLLCGHFTTEVSPLPRAFVFTTDNETISVEPSVPSSFDLLERNSNCAASVARAGAFLSPGNGCEGLDQSADQFNAASDYLERRRRTCAGAKQISHD